MEEVLKDERFSHILTDPRFRKIPKNVRKIKVDNRFKNLFKSKNFKEKCRVDERGRSLNLEPSENLQKLYNLEEETNEGDTNLVKDEERRVSDKKSGKKTKKDFKREKKLKSKTFNADTDEQYSSTHVNNLKNALKCKKSNEKNSNKSFKKDTSVQSPHSIEDDIDTSDNIDTDEEESLKSSNNQKNSFKLQKSNKKKSFKKDILVQSQHSVKDNKDDIDSPDDNDEEESLKPIHKNLKKTENSNLISKQKKRLHKSKETVTKKEYDSRFILKEKSDEENDSASCGENTLEDDKATLKNSDEKAESEESEEEEESESSSSEEESEDTDSDDSIGEKSESFDHQWEEQHERAPDADEITRRLAVCNMDWDRIRAEDLYVVFNSFKPVDTTVLSVKIYPSEFGLKRMEEEKLKGPPELVEKTLDPDEEDDDDDENDDIKGGKYNREKLRQYQMNRLKYYYAIVECDTPETANSLYEQLNGMEYESSSVRFDLRFVPDDMVFDQEPTSIANNVPDLTEYKPRLFVTTALQQVKVGLTWDETDPHRRETLQKAFTEPDSIENDIKTYLASSSEESEDEEVADEENSGVKLSTKERIQKFRELLESINEQEKEKDAEKYEMEITWEPGVKEKTESLVKEKLEEKTYTPFEELQKKKKEKQKLKKKEKKAQIDHDESLSDESDSDISQETKSKGEKSVSKKTDELYLISDARKLDDEMQKSKKKRKKKKVKESNDDIQVDINDPRFSAIYTSPLFNIDPSDPHFKETPGNLAIIAEKQRRLKNKAASQGGSNKKFKYN